MNRRIGKFCFSSAAQFLRSAFIVTQSASAQNAENLQ